jgi:hypothetical protein
MLIKFALLAPLLLLGCATADDLMNNKPSLVYQSAKEAQTVAQCIAGQWKSYSPPAGAAVPVKLSERLGSYTLSVDCGGGKNCKVAEITPTAGKQSKTTMYSIAIGEGSYLDHIDGCQ